MTGQRARDKNDFDALKAQKKEQGLKSAKQAKESLMKLKKAESQVTELRTQFEARAEVIKSQDVTQNELRQEIVNLREEQANALKDLHE